LGALLATWPGMQVAAEAANGIQAIRLVEELCPDLVLMDARMPEMDGLEATRLIKARWQGIRVVVLSMYPEYEEEALAAGADAFISKGDPPECLMAAITGSR
jgi:DNA-binding NarL/FixJ family response regulator